MRATDLRILPLSLTDITSISNMASASSRTPFELRGRQNNQQYQISQTSAPQDYLTNLFAHQYGQFVKEPEAQRHRFQIHTDKILTGASRDTATGNAMLQLRDASTGKTEVQGPYRHVVVASGYERLRHKLLLASLGDLLEAQDDTSVDRNYRLNFRRGTVQSDSGIWILDGFANGSNDVFSFLAARTDRLASSILDSCRIEEERHKTQNDDSSERAVL